MQIPGICTSESWIPCHGRSICLWRRRPELPPMLMLRKSLRCLLRRADIHQPPPAPCLGPDTVTCVTLTKDLLELVLKSRRCHNLIPLCVKIQTLCRRFVAWLLTDSRCTPSRWGLFVRGRTNAPRFCVFIWTSYHSPPFVVFVWTRIHHHIWRSLFPERHACHLSSHYHIHTHTRRYVTTVMDITTFVIITQLTKVLYIYIKKRSRGRTQRRGEEFRASHGRDLMRAPSPGGSA